MINRILTVGGLTLLSRVTGFARDIVMAAVLGAGPIADAFLVAFRLPNHFRAIFAEGAFAAAFVPAYARIRTQNGVDAAKLFGDRIFTLLLASQIVLLALALLFTPRGDLAAGAGFRRRAVALRSRDRAHAHHVSVPAADDAGDALLRHPQFARAFRDRRRGADPAQPHHDRDARDRGCSSRPPGHAAAWGVLIAGVLEVLLVGGATLRADVMTTLRRPWPDADVKRFFKALGPATVGSAGVQLALFADTIIASFLAAGALSALYYADRLYQLPGGVIGIAVGTVLLPEMARRIAAGDDEGARAAQQRAIEFTLLLAIPCVAAFLIVPDLIMRALFMRGKFTADDANAAAMTLAAYTIGLIPFVLMRSAVSTFLARGDTATPVKAALAAVAVNVALKIVFLLTTDLQQVGLALATSIGTWINFGLILWFGLRAGFMSFDAPFRRDVGKLAAAGIALAAVLWIAQWPVLAMTAGLPGVHNALALVLLGFLGALVYGGAILGLFGKAWLAGLWRTPQGRHARFRSSGTRVNVRGLPSRSTPTSIDPADPLAGEQADQVVRAGHRHAVERHDHVAGQQTGAVRRAARLGRRDRRGRALREPVRKLHAARNGRLLRRYSDVGAPHAAVPHQLAEHEVRRVRRDREADALRALDDRRVHADHLAARGDQRPAGIAGVERRVGLDHVVDQPSACARAASARAPRRRPPSRSTRSRADCRSPPQAGRAAAVFESPSRAAGSVTGASTRTSARSVSGSSPTTRAVRLRPSVVISSTRAAPPTTWLLVSTSPSGATMTPEPEPARCALPAVPHVDPHHGRADRGRPRR